MTLKYSPTLLSCVLMISLSACSTTSDPTRFYSLQSSQEKPFQVMANPRYSLAIASVRIPRLIDRSQIISRSGKHEIKRSEYHQWGGSIQEEIEKALALGLEESLESGLIQIQPSNLKSRPEYELYITILQLDGTLGRSATLNLDWQLINRSSPSGNFGGSTRISQKLSGPGYEDYVAGLAELLGKSSAEIAQSVEKQLR